MLAGLVCACIIAVTTESAIMSVTGDACHYPNEEVRSGKRGDNKTGGGHSPPVEFDVGVGARPQLTQIWSHFAHHKEGHATIEMANMRKRTRAKFAHLLECLIN